MMGLATASVNAKASKASPVFTKYKLRDGNIVNMSLSQKAIANGQWRHLTPQELYRIESASVITIETTLNNGDVIQGTGFISHADQVITNYHMARGAKSIVCCDYTGKNMMPNYLLATNLSMSLA